MSSIVPVIAREPLGLLSYLDTKTGGRRPQQLAEFVQPTLEMRLWYDEANVVTASGVTAGVGVGYNALTGFAGQPSQGSVWLVKRIWARAIVTAANFAAFGVGIARQSNSVTQLLALGEHASGGVIGALAGSVVARWEGELLLRNGGDICVFAFDVGGVAPAVTVIFEFVPLSI
jgi:hypothetical protein